MNGKELKYKIQETGRKVWWKTKDIGQKAMDCGRQTVKWAVQNPDKAAALAATTAAVTGGLNKVIRSVNRNVTMKRVEREKRTRIYDHSMNAYLYTKKPLTAEQIKFVNNERRRTGKRTAEILYDMDLLRKR